MRRFQRLRATTLCGQPHAERRDSGQAMRSLVPRSLQASAKSARSTATLRSRSAQSALYSANAAASCSTRFCSAAAWSSSSFEFLAGNTCLCCSAQAACALAASSACFCLLNTLDRPVGAGGATNFGSGGGCSRWDCGSGVLGHLARTVDVAPFASASRYPHSRRPPMWRPAENRSVQTHRPLAQSVLQRPPVAQVRELLSHPPRQRVLEC